VKAEGVVKAGKGQECPETKHNDCKFKVKELQHKCQASARGSVILRRGLEEEEESQREGEPVVLVLKKRKEGQLSIRKHHDSDRSTNPKSPKRGGGERKKKKLRGRESFLMVFDRKGETEGRGSSPKNSPGKNEQ